MTSPEPTPERIDELLAGATPRDEREREVVALMGRLREADDAPSAALRARVRALGSEAPATQGWFRRLPGVGGGLLRGPRIAIAGGVAVLALAAVVAIPLTTDGSSEGEVRAETPVERTIEPEAAGVADARGRAAADQALASPESGAEIAPEPPRAGGGSAVPDDAIAPGPDPGRPQEVRVETVVQVGDVSELSRASAAAMKGIRELGGFTVSSRYDVPGAEQGTNQLLFKVPSARVEEALEGFAEIGSITGQNASLTDLGAELSASQLQITRRRERVRALREELAENPDDPTLTAQLNSVERQLAQLIERRKKIQERARLATINLTLTTAGPAVVDGEQNRFIAAFTRSADRLGVVLEWVISAAVFLLPLGLLAWLAVWLARGARGRDTRRLMDAV